MEDLRTLRKQKGLSQKQLGKILNVTSQAIANYENGIRKVNIEQVLILSKLFDVSAEEIIKAQINSHQNDQ